jgi:uncharacterized protein (TIGR02246 family)
MKTLSMMCAVMSLGLMACGQRAVENLPPEVTRAFEDAFAKDDPAKVSTLFTEDGEILLQDRPAVKGRQEIQQYVADQISPMIMFDLTTDVTVAREDLAMETGSYTFRDTRRGADIERGKYVHVWRKQGNDWKLFRAMYNTDEPMNAQVSVAHDEP